MCVLVDVGLAFILFTSLNMIITNTKEDHFIIRGLPNIDLHTFRHNTLHRRKEGGKVIGSLWCVCCYLISGWDCLLFLVKSRRITLGWGYNALNNSFLCRGIHFILCRLAKIIQAKFALRIKNKLVKRTIYQLFCHIHKV